MDDYLFPVGGIVVGFMAAMYYLVNSFHGAWLSWVILIAGGLVGGAVGVGIKILSDRK